MADRSTPTHFRSRTDSPLPFEAVITIPGKRRGGGDWAPKRLAHSFARLAGDASQPIVYGSGTGENRRITCYSKLKSTSVGLSP
jgi:hypothetical protein